MALTQLTDIIESGSGPRVFADYVQVLSTELSAFSQSGVAQTNQRLTEFLANGGQTIDMPSWDDLDNTSANISSAAAASPATPLKIAAKVDVAIRNNRNQHWSVAVLSGDMAGSDPFNAIAVRVATYWARERQRAIISQFRGILQDNEDNDSEDFRNDDSLPGAGTPTAANLFSAEGFLDTKQTLGDASSILRAMACHSVIANRMAKNDLIDFIPDSEGKLTIPTYQGLRVIVDDGMPAIAFSGNIRYSTWLFAEGVIQEGLGSPKNPATTSVEDLASDGAGQELLHSRVKFAHHVPGIKWAGGSLVGASPTDAELVLAANWDRVRADRKLIAFAEYRTNG